MKIRLISIPLLLAFLLFVCGCPQSSAQTTVNISVTDSSVQSWNNGSWTVILVPNGQPTQSSTIISGGGSLNPQSGVLSGSGTASMSLPANVNIIPALSVWKFTVCPQATSTCFDQTVVVTTSSPQSVTITPPAPKVNSGPLAMAYNQNEVSGGIGSQYYDLTATNSKVCIAGTTSTCTTWVSSGGSGGGGVSNFSAGNLPTLFNTSVTNPGSTPNLSFTLNNAAGTSWFGNPSGISAAPSFNTSALPDSLIPTTIPRLSTTNTFSLLNTFTGGLSVPPAALVGNGSNVSLKNISGAELWVDTPNGSDSNDGRSPGSPMATVSHAICSLPGGNCSTHFAGNGTIYVTNNSNANSVSGAGIWIMGSVDPNYASPPSGWLKTVNGSTGIKIVGISSQTYGPNGQQPAAAINGGSNIDHSHPLIWLSGLNNATEIDNIASGSGSAQRSLVIGECSTGTRTNTCSTSTVSLNNDHFSIPLTAGYGPTCDITGNSFWITLNHSGCSGSDTVNSPTSDNAAALLLDGRTNAGVDLILINDFRTLSGGIKYYQGSNLGGFTVHDLTTEGPQSEPAVELASGGNGSFVSIDGVVVADAVSTSVGVENDMGGDGSGVSVRNVFGGGVNTKGPMSVLSQYHDNLLSNSVSPLRSGQTGFINGWVFGQRDDVQRVSALRPVRFLNGVTSSECSNTWTASQFSGTTTFTCGATDPMGGANAGTATSTAATPQEDLSFTPGGGGVENVTLSVGEYIVAGVWSLSTTANGYSQQALSASFLRVTGTGFVATPRCTETPNLGDGEWTWNLCVAKVTAIGTNPAQLQFGVVFDSTHGVSAYGAVLNFIPPGVLSENEVYSYANSMGAYSTSCTVGTFCGMKETINFVVPPTGVGSTSPSGIVGQIPLLTTQPSTYTASSTGLPWGNSDSPVISTPYVIQCDSTTSVLDRGKVIVLQAGASIINAPDPNASGCGGNFDVSIYDDNAGSVTVNAGGTSVFNVIDGTTHNDGVTSFGLVDGQSALINYKADGTIGMVRKVAGGGGGGGTTIEVNGVNAAVQNPINFINGTSFNGLTPTFTNPAATGNIQLGFTGTLGNAGLTNSTITPNGVTCTLGSACNITSLFDTNAFAGFLLQTTPSAVNGLQVTDESSGTSPVFSPQGSDANLGLTIQGKGTAAGASLGISSAGQSTLASASGQNLSLGGAVTSTQSNITIQNTTTINENSSVSAVGLKIKQGNASPTGDVLEAQSSGGVSQTIIGPSFTFTKLGKTSLSGDGVLADFGESNLTAQTGSITSTALYTTNASAPYSTGLYAVTYYVDCTTGQVGATVTLTITWNDGAAQTATPVSSLACGTTNTFASGTQVVYSTASQAISYSTTAAGFTTGNYAIHLAVTSR